MSSQLDAIKARAAVVAGKPDNREPTEKEFDALIDGAIHDVPRLVAAVEAVLELPSRFDDCDCDHCSGYEEALEGARDAIHQALGEGEK